MLRTFDRHRVRSVRSLDGFWDFTTTPDSGRDGRPKRYERSIHIPSCWESLPGLENYRGRAWVRTTFDGLPGFASRLVFGGVSHTADAYVDGQLLAHHEDAFTPWAALAPDAQDRAHTLTLAIDNTFGEHASLHLPNDYYTYGGVTRPVELQHVPEVFIERIWATPRLDAKRGRWSLDVRAWVRNWSAEPLRRNLTVTIGGVVHDLGTLRVPAGGARDVRQTLDAPDVEPWRPDRPRLYELVAELYDGPEVVDDLIDRVGFRTIETKGRKLLLNGEPIRLRGYNRHEDHPSFGCAIPLQQMVQDLEIIRDLGCNFIRTSHYPYDQRFLDLCDELGILVWEESHARAVDMNHPRFRDQIAASTREMIEWHHNHPCIILWGCLNECETRTARGRAHYKRVIDLIRKLDGSRPVTYASMYHEEDICFGLADVVAVNIYTGWYNAELDDTAPRLDRFLKWLHSDKSRGGQGKPVIVSEFGGGAIPGYTNPARVHWTEEYLGDLLDHELGVYLHHPDVVGAAIWQFCDVRVTTEGGWWRYRPRTMNNKGTVNEFRRPKRCYGVVQRRMREAARRHDGG